MLACLRALVSYFNLFNHFVECAFYERIAFDKALLFHSPYLQCCSLMLTLKTPGLLQWHHSGVFKFSFSVFHKNSSCIFPGIWKCIWHSNHTSILVKILLGLPTLNAFQFTTSETGLYHYNYELYVHLALGAAKK